MSEPGLIVVYVGRDRLEAQIVAGLLESEGIKALVPGTELMDEFGSAMRAAPTDVVVGQAQAEAAKDIVAAWKDREASQGSD